MNTRFIFSRQGNKLQHQPRTLSESRRAKSFQKAAAEAEAVKREVLEVRDFVQTLDGSEYDSAPRTKGRISLQGQPEYKGASLEGRVVGKEWTVRADGPDGVTEYRQQDDRFEVRRYPGEKTSFSRTLYDGENPLLILSGRDKGNRLLGFKYKNDDFDKPKSLTNLQTGHKIFNTYDQEWKISNPQAYARTEAKAELVEQVYEEIKALDQSENDLNPREGEVLIQDQEIAGRKMSGSIRPFFSLAGSISEHGSQSTLFSNNAPSLHAWSSDTDETFRIMRGDMSRYSFQDNQDFPWDARGQTRLSESVIYEDGKERFRLNTVNDIGSQYFLHAVSDIKENL